MLVSYLLLTSEALKPFKPYDQNFNSHLLPYTFPLKVVRRRCQNINQIHFLLTTPFYK